MRPDSVGKSQSQVQDAAFGISRNESVTRKIAGFREDAARWHGRLRAVSLCLFPDRNSAFGCHSGTHSSVPIRRKTKKNTTGSQPIVPVCSGFARGTRRAGILGVPVELAKCHTGRATLAKRDHRGALLLLSSYRESTLRCDWRRFGRLCAVTALAAGRLARANKKNCH